MTDIVFFVRTFNARNFILEQWFFSDVVHLKKILKPRVLGFDRKLLVNQEKVTPGFRSLVLTHDGFSLHPNVKVLAQLGKNPGIYILRKKYINKNYVTCDSFIEINCLILGTIFKFSLFSIYSLELSCFRKYQKKIEIRFFVDTLDSR